MRWILWPAVLVLAAACGEGGDDAAGTITAQTRTASAASNPLAWSRTLDLPAGAATARFAIVAPHPPRHTWDVRLTAPSSADVGVTIRTWYGQVLHVFDAPRRRREAGAARARPTTRIARFPALEAQRAGRWTVVVTKASREPVRVQVEIRFERV